MSQRQLLINSLRMRPDRIIVGEVRGEEALDMLQAMNTGHDGSLTTVHANTPRDAISRLEVMVTLANANMHLTAIRQQIASAVHLLVQCSRMSDGTRRVTSITEVTGMEADIVTLQDIFVFEKRGISPDGRVSGRFCATGILPKFNEKLLAAGIRLPTEIFDEMVEVGGAVMVIVFAVAFLTARSPARVYSGRLDRRDTALALRRLAARAADKASGGAPPPPADRHRERGRGRMTGRCWTACD